MFYNFTPKSRLLLGTAQYPSPQVLAQAIAAAQCEIVTVSLRRECRTTHSGQTFYKMVQHLGVKVLPNTAGCGSVREAVTTAHMARELFGTPWIKLEVIGNDDTLAPDVMATVEAARILCTDGFEVFPYTTDDLSIAERLLKAGCQVLMPWGAPIGSGRGLNNIYGLRSLRAHFAGVPLIIDAGIGRPSHAACAMELGYDAVLLNTAVAQSGNCVTMARAFAQAIQAGHDAYTAGFMPTRDMAAPSTPVFGMAQL